ncbi:MAG: hypothetical protein ACOC1O_00580 [bacterium]
MIEKSENVSEKYHLSAMSENYLDAGKYYTVIDNKMNLKMIGLVHLGNNGNNDGSTLRGVATYLCIDNHDYFFRFKNEWCYSSDTRYFRESTDYEKKWLDECIERNRAITEEEFSIQYYYHHYNDQMTKAYEQFKKEKNMDKETQKLYKVTFKNSHPSEKSFFVIANEPSSAEEKAINFKKESHGKYLYKEDKTIQSIELIAENYQYTYTDNILIP